MTKLKYFIVPALGLALLAAFFAGRTLRTDVAPRRVATAQSLPTFSEAPAAVNDFVYTREAFLELLQRDPAAARKLARVFFARDEEFLIDYVDDVAVIRTAKRRDLAVARLSTLVTDDAADALLAYLYEGERTAAEALAAHGTRGAARRLLLAWEKLFKAGEPLGTYYILEALARLPDARELILAALRGATDPSRRNMLMSLAPRIDKAWAYELALEILRGETHRQVRNQAIAMLGMIGTAEAEAQLLALLESDDYAEAANVLLALDGVHVDAARLLAAFQVGSDFTKAVLAALLARDPDCLPAVRDFIKAHASSPDEVLRFYALSAYAALAMNDAAASAELVDLYVGFDRHARDLHPAVFEAVTKSTDARMEPILRDTLADEDANAAHRVIAAHALAEKGTMQPVVEALKITQQPEVVQSLAAIVASSPGGVDTLKSIAGGEASAEKKLLLDQQIEVWSKVGP